MLLTIATGWLPAAVGRTTSSSSPVSPSSASGGISWSCIHIFLVFVCVLWSEKISFSVSISRAID
jgi:hypothetical protein